MSDLLFIDRDEVLGRIENAISALTGGLDIETQRLFVNAVNQVEPLSVSEELVAALRGRAAQSVSEELSLIEVLCARMRDVFPHLTKSTHADFHYDLLCPVCHHECNHIQEVFTLTGSDEHEAIGAYPGTQSKGSTGERRSALVMRIAGECGHVWDLIIQQHKGTLHVKSEAAQDSQADARDRSPVDRQAARLEIISTRNGVHVIWQRGESPDV